MDLVADRHEAALQRLKRSRTFARATRQVEFLRFLIEHAESHEDSAKEAYIGTVFYERPGTYDLRYDSVVRVNVKRLRTRLETYYKTEGKDDRERIIIPLGSYRPFLEAVEVVPVESHPGIEANLPGVAEPYAAGLITAAVASEATGHGERARFSRSWLLLSVGAACVAAVLFGIHRLHRPAVLPAVVTSNLLSWPLTPGRDVETEAMVSPDDRTLAYVTRRPGNLHFQIFLRPFKAIDVMGTPLDTGPGDALRPAWSPDGRMLVFCIAVAAPATSRLCPRPEVPRAASL